MKTVLLIEDDPDIREISRATLAHRGYQTLEAASGAEGVQIARSETPDLILLDLGLPGMDGFATAATLKQLAETAHIPIVVMSAFSRAADAERAAQLGITAYLQKPIEPAELAEHVARILGSEA